MSVNAARGDRTAEWFVIIRGEGDVALNQTDHRLTTLHRLNDGDQRQKQRDDDGSDDHGQEHDHDRLQQRGQTGDGVIHLIVVDFRHLQEHLGELPGFLADVDHADDHGREDAAGFERLHDGFTFLDAVVHLADGLANDVVTRRFAGDVERLEDRHAAGHERTQRAAEPRDGAFPGQVAEQRQAQEHLVDDDLAVRRGCEPPAPRSPRR